MSAIVTSSILSESSAYDAYVKQRKIMENELIEERLEISYKRELAPLELDIYKQVLDMTHEFVLYKIYGSWSKIELIITRKNVFHILYPANSEDMIQAEPYKICLLYTFTNPLGVEDLQLLKKLETVPQFGEYTQSIANGIRSPQKKIYQAQFESIIRLIPGSYDNDDWVQLDGFFGLYFNRMSRGLSMYPQVKKF
jgi:hypothetical protein